MSRVSEIMKERRCSYSEACELAAEESSHAQGASTPNPSHASLCAEIADLRQELREMKEAAAVDRACNEQRKHILAAMARLEVFDIAGVREEMAKALI